MATGPSVRLVGTFAHAAGTDRLVRALQSPPRGRRCRCRATCTGAAAGVEVIPVSLGLGCCGAAGPHLLAHPEQGDALAQPIVDAIVALQLDAAATTNIGCALHLGERLALRGITLSVRHPVAFLADRLTATTP